MEIGNTLKNVREEKGISLETAEAETKIRRKYLEALEKEEFDVLPGRVYARGFIKNYATFLGISTGPLLSAFDQNYPSEIKEEDNPEKEKLTNIESNSGGKIVKIALGFIAVFAVIVIVLPFLKGTGKGKIASPALPENSNMAQQQENSSVPGKGQGEPAVPGENNAGVAPQQSGQQKAVNIVLDVFESDCWMYVEVDGKPEFIGMVPAGQVKSFSGDERVYFRLGNAGVVNVEYNGQKIGVLGGVGDVVNKEYLATGTDSAAGRSG